MAEQPSTAPDVVRQRKSIASVVIEAAVGRREEVNMINLAQVLQSEAGKLYQAPDFFQCLFSSLSFNELNNLLVSPNRARAPILPQAHVISSSRTDTPIDQSASDVPKQLDSPPLTNTSDEPGEDKPSYDDSQKQFQFVFLNPKTGAYDFAMGRHCKQKSSFISHDIVERNKLMEFADSNRTIRLPWREDLLGDGDLSKTRCTRFRIVDDAYIEGNAAFGTGYLDKDEDLGALQLPPHAPEAPEDELSSNRDVEDDASDLREGLQGGQLAGVTRMPMEPNGMNGIDPEHMAKFYFSVTAMHAEQQRQRWMQRHSYARETWDQNYDGGPDSSRPVERTGSKRHAG